MLTEGAVRSLLTELAETASERARQARQEAATVIADLRPGAHDARADTLVASAADLVDLSQRLRSHAAGQAIKMSPRLLADIRSGRSVRLSKKKEASRVRAMRARLAGTAARARAFLRTERHRAEQGLADAPGAHGPLAARRHRMEPDAAPTPAQPRT
jgi:hypothetical protein